MHGNISDIHEVHDIDELKQRLTWLGKVINDALEQWHASLGVYSCQMRAC